MRRWLHLAAWLYPPAWRARYAEEFAALLDDLRPTPHDLWDIFRGAIFMQLSTPSVYLKLGAITAALGAIVAGGVSFALPQRYVSSAVMRIAPAGAGANGPSHILATQRLMQMQQEILSRSSLAEMIQRPELDLYRGDRARYPLEDIIQGMRQHDVRIQPIDDSNFRVSFEYQDPKTAQAVVRTLVTKFVEANVTTSQKAIRQVDATRTSHDVPAPNSAVWRFLKIPEPANPPATPSRQPPLSPDQLHAALTTNLEVLDPATLPNKPIQPNRAGIVAIGLGAGFGLGLLLAFLRRRPLRWTLQMAAAAIAGFAAALALAFYRELDPLLFACLGSAAGMSIAAWRMRDRAAWNPAPYVKSALATGALTAIFAGFASFLFADHYISTAVLRVYPQIASMPVADTDGVVAERLSRIEQEALSRNSLAELIQRPSLDLYRGERQRRPLEDIIHDLRARYIRILPVTAGSALTISFEYTDRFKAQAVVREMITKYVEGNVTAERNSGRATEQGAIVIEVLDPASLPELASFPNRYTIAALGFAAGLPLGILIAWFRRRPPGQAFATLRFAAATGAAGALVATAIGFAIPSRYVSTAVLRAPPQSGDHVQRLMIEVLSRQNLGDELRRNVRVQTLDVGPRGQTRTFSISYESTDPEKAHNTVQSLVTRFVERNATFSPPGTDPAILEVLDAASLPEVPSFPPRGLIALSGLLAGLLLAPVARALAPAASALSPAC